MCTSMLYHVCVVYQHTITTTQACIIPAPPKPLFLLPHNPPTHLSFATPHTHTFILPPHPHTPTPTHTHIRTTCWGQDEYLPVSNTCEKWFNLGLTMVDGLDTMMLMGLDAEVLAARQWIAHNMSCAQDNDKTNLFETTIRILGGLLSAFHLSGGDALYLYRALELGLRLLPAFNSASGMLTSCGGCVDQLWWVC